MNCFHKINKIGENKPKRDMWAMTGPYRSDMLEIMRLERVKDQKLLAAKKHMESFEMVQKRRGQFFKKFFCFNKRNLLLNIW